MRETFLPFAQPLIGEKEKLEVLDTLDSGWITAGPKTRRFEEKVSDYLGGDVHVIAVSSCTAGLHLQLIANGIGPGDEVITSPLTFCSTVNTILHAGATPVLADIDRRTFNTNPDQIRSKVTPRTRAIVPVHYAGQPCDMDAIRIIADEHGLLILSDAAHALGATYKGQPIGKLEDAASFSLYAIKNITTGEGGLVVTRDEQVAARIRVYSLHGMDQHAWERYSDQGSWYYEVTFPGYKYNFTDIQAALGLHQLDRLDKFISIRQRYTAMYDEAFSKYEELYTPYVMLNVRHTRHLYTLLIEPDRLKIDRAEFINQLRAANIGTTVNYVPITRHPYYRESLGIRTEDYPETDWVWWRTISLPLYPKMTEEDVHDVIEAVQEVVEKARCKSLAF